MKLRSVILTSVIAGSLMVASSAQAQVFGEKRPPADAKPLSGVIKALEDQGYRVTEVEFERGHWEIEAYQTGSDKEIEFQVDPRSGEIKKD